jgi:MoxR-like ATPase
VSATDPDSGRARAETLATGRLWAADRAPYLATALFAMSATMVDGLGTMGADPHWRLYVDPTVLERWSIEEVGSVLIHEAHHLIRSHAERAEALGVGAAEHRRWNVAGDFEINDDLRELSLPSGGLDPEKYRLQSGELAETYYEILASWSRLPLAECGSGADGTKRAWDTGDPPRAHVALTGSPQQAANADDAPPGVDNVEADLIRQQVAQGIRGLKQAGGHVPGSLERWAGAFLRPHVDWRRELAARVLGASLDMPVVTVIASLREPADFAGLPVVTAEGSIRLAELSWARLLVEHRRGILFLDEITTAAPAVQAALLRVVLERVVGDVALPDAIAIVAAANPPDVAAGGWDLSPPLANRFCHIDWPVDPDRFNEALTSGWPAPIVPDLTVPDERDVSIKVRSSVAGFLRSRAALLYALPEEVTAAGRAWASPRSWDMAAELWAAAESRAASDEVVMLLIAGCVGPGAARELLAWRRDADLPDPEDVLADPSRFTLPERGDRQFAVLSALAAAVNARPSKERWEAALEIVQQAVSRGSADVAAVAARSLAQNVPPGVEALPPAVGSLAPVLGRAGLLRRR